MAWGKNKELEVILQPYKDQIESLKAEIVELKEEKNKLLDSLLSVKTPEAYKEMRSDIKEFKNIPEIDKETLEKMRVQEETTRKWFEGLERPTFNSPEDLVGMLDKWLTKEPVPLVPDPVIEDKGYTDA